MTEKIVIGVDVGGTFTDILAFDEKTGSETIEQALVFKDKADKRHDSTTSAREDNGATSCPPRRANARSRCS